MKVAGLIRENIQNSLDGRLLGYEGPVQFTITTGTIKKKDVPGIGEVIERIHCLKGRNSYTKEAIEHMVKTSEEEEVHYISFEDSNTRGLSGAKNGQIHSPKDTWAIYAYNKGVHSEEEDAAVETSRGGSHGVGKIASNAASDLNVMYFANCDANGDQHLGGTVQLVKVPVRETFPLIQTVWILIQIHLGNPHIPTFPFHLYVIVVCCLNSTLHRYLF